MEQSGEYLFDPIELSKVNYATECSANYSNPANKRLKGYEKFEANKPGRMAYTPEKDKKAVEGILPTYNGKRYEPVIPKYILPKIYG